MPKDQQEAKIERAKQKANAALDVGTVRGTEGTGEFERYTPSRYIELAREVLDGKLASSKEIKQRVKDWQGDFLRV